MSHDQKQHQQLSTSVSRCQQVSTSANKCQQVSLLAGLLDTTCCERSLSCSLLSHLFQLFLLLPLFVMEGFVFIVQFLGTLLWCLQRLLFATFSSTHLVVLLCHLIQYVHLISVTICSLIFFICPH